jgi:hypothetical protein
LISEEKGEILPILLKPASEQQWHLESVILRSS